MFAVRGSSHSSVQTPVAQRKSLKPAGFELELEAFFRRRSRDRRTTLFFDFFHLSFQSLYRYLSGAYAHGLCRQQSQLCSSCFQLENRAAACHPDLLPIINLVLGD